MIRLCRAFRRHHYLCDLLRFRAFCCIRRILAQRLTVADCLAQRQQRRARLLTPTTLLLVSTISLRWSYFLSRTLQRAHSSSPLFSMVVGVYLSPSPPSSPLAPSSVLHSRLRCSPSRSRYKFSAHCSTEWEVILVWKGDRYFLDNFWFLHFPGQQARLRHSYR